MPRLSEYMTIKEASEYLGVSQNTLRNWGATGKIKERWDRRIRRLQFQR